MSNIHNKADNVQKAFGSITTPHFSIGECSGKTKTKIWLSFKNICFILIDFFYVQET